MSHYNTIFLQAKEKLNEEQLDAVNTIYGPVMVLAGPGTGKTQILAMRIANLLQSEAQVNPHEILCLTFTDAGRLAMRRRLNEIVGMEIAGSIAIHTFHSFCNEVIQRNVNHFNKEILEEISPLEKYDVLKEVLSHLPHNHIFNTPKNPYKNIYSLLTLFDTMKKENWTSEFVIAKADEYMAGLTEENAPDFFYKKKYKDKEKGDKKPSYYDEEERMNKTKAAAAIAPLYAHAMLAANRYDYNDMIQWVVKKFASDDNFLSRYAEQYQYILVDEYQDTNGSQSELVRLLSSADESPNLFVVGDDDQCIYRFQGASASNMTAIKERHPDAKIIQLRSNYRSYQEIISSAEQFVTHNTDRLKAADQPLIAARGQGHTQPLMVGLQSAREQRVYITQHIEKLLHNKVPAREIAVLHRNNKECLDTARYLQIANIPYVLSTEINLLELPLVKKLLQVLAYVNAELDTPFSGDKYLFEILHHPYFEIEPLHIARLAMQRQKASVANNNSSGSLREYIGSVYAGKGESLFATDNNAKLQNTFAKLEALITAAVQQPILAFFTALVKATNVYAYIIKQPNKIELIDEITALFQFVQEEAHRNPSMTLNHFVALLGAMQENDLSVNYVRTMGKENGVQLCTIHKSKGLEYEHVIVSDAIASKWESKRSKGDSIKIPPTVIDGFWQRKDTIKEENKAEDQAEMRRLLYVAATRAKKELLFCYYVQDEKGKDISPSAFLGEYFPAEKSVERAYAPEVLQPAQLALFEPIWLLLAQQDVNIELIEKEHIDKVLSKFSLSVSALNNYIKCPLHFYFENIIRVPNGTNENTTLGSAAHKALEYAYADLKENEMNFPSLEKFINRFKYAMHKNREHFTSEGFNNKLSYGIEFLTKFYNEKIIGSNTNVDIEYNLNLEWNGIPLKGFVDKLEKEGNHVHIIDYKTGDAESKYAKENLKTPKRNKEGELKPGGSYWRQGVFYSMLLGLDKKMHYQPISAQFQYIEPSKPSGEFITHTFYPSPEDISIVQDEIMSAWQNIQAHKFYIGCGKIDDCNWCRFVRENELSGYLKNEEVAQKENLV